MAGEIIVGYDGREGSVAALRTATAVAAAFNRPLVIVFGYRPAPIGGEVTDLGRAVRAVGERVTAEAVATAHTLEPSVTAVVELVDDRPAEAILRAADEYDALDGRRRLDEPRADHGRSPRFRDLPRRAPLDPTGGRGADRRRSVSADPR